MGENRTFTVTVVSICLAMLSACAPVNTEFDLAYQLSQQKQYEPAIEKYRYIISITGPEDKYHIWAHNNICDAYRKTDRHQEAIPFCEKAVALDPKYEQAHFNLCYAFWSLNKYQEALASCLEGTKLSADPASHYDNLRRLYGNLGDRATAYQYVLKWRTAKGDADVDKVLNGKDAVAENLQALILSEGPRTCREGDLNSCVFTASVYRKKGDPAKFTELAGYACSKGSAEACTSLCDDHVSGKKHTEAIPYCSKAVELNPGNELSRALLCSAYWYLGKHNEALTNCLEASRLASDPAAYYNSLWGLSVNVGDRAGAYQYVLKWRNKKGDAPVDAVLNGKDKNAEILYNLIASEGAKACGQGDLESCLTAGRAHYHKNDREKSWQLYSRACSLNHIESCLFLTKNGVQLSRENQERVAAYERQKRLEEEERRRREEERQIAQERRERREQKRRELVRRCKSRCDREFDSCMARARAAQNDPVAGLTQSLSCTEVFVCTNACEDLESQEDLAEVEERKQNFRQAMAGMNNSISEGVQNYNAAVQIRRDAEQQAAEQRQRQAEAQREQQQQQQNRQQQARQDRINQERERQEAKKREDERRRQEAQVREKERQAAREKKEQEAAAKARKNPECNWRTSQVTGEKRHPTAPGSCQGEMLLYLTNNSSSTVICEVAPVRSGSIETRWGKTANITLRPGERGGGQMGGLWWCGYGPNDTFKFICALSTDPSACHVDAIKRSVGR